MCMESLQKKTKATTVDEYISRFPSAVQEILQKLRKIILELDSHITERISYGIPVFEIGGKYVIYIGAYAKHISVYPLAEDFENEFSSELQNYKHFKGTIQFPLDKPFPYDFVTRMVAFRIKNPRK